MLQWVIEATKTSPSIDEILVATDHPQIAELAQKCQVKAVMTSSDLPSGSDRVWTTVQNYKDVEIVINVQGDEPLLKGSLLDQLVEPLLKDSEKTLQMSTLACSINPQSLLSRNTAKIVLNKNQEAIYFSRFPIPYSRVDALQKEEVCMKHIGLYAYRFHFLREFCQTNPVAMEIAEGLEQLRALYLGAKIKVVPVEADSWGVDIPEDIKVVEQKLKQ